MRWAGGTLGFVVGASLHVGEAIAAAPELVPTFENLGIGWVPEGGGAEDRVCTVRYRQVGTEAWRDALPLEYAAADDEYRGSIVGLYSGTEYEIELSLQDGATENVSVTTWSENLPISQTVELPASSSSTLVIDSSGSPDGYVLYTAGQGQSAVIDVEGNEEDAITIDASYVIVRGLELRNAGRRAIRLLGQSHHIVIEENDISGWGGIDTDGWGRNYDAAVYSSSTDVSQIVVQRNKMHHPRSDANSWDEFRVPYDTYHPMGPQAVVLFNSQGNHVIRYNEVYSDEEHRYNDGFGAGSNFSWEGFPNRDTDIYGNTISHCWDDGIESEGANRNVRIYGNYLDNNFVMIATASTSVGPLYIWRNLSGSARTSPFGTWDEAGRGGFLKTSDGAHVSGEPGGGKIFVFHNTLLQPDPPSGMTNLLGVAVGLGWGGPMLNTATRNNILHTYRDTSRAIRDRDLDPLGDYDYDLYNGTIEAADGYEPHGIHDTPVYDPNNAEGEFALDPSSPGFDDGVILPNFNDAYQGAGPDRGAHEAGTAAMQFGVDAYRNIAPTADAGSAQTIVDDDGDGRAAVALDGSGSTDPDGYLVRMTWTQNGSEVGSNPTLTLELALGDHQVVLSV
ncbi:MAG: hypothetical protein JRI55_03125, partial [Deltaproteobacteria bacterium]|nr:hypothetical protein [Deltaproteobacteria bacterium]